MIMNMADDIPNKIKQKPYWKILLQPTQEVTIPSLPECINVIEKSMVSLRGGNNYPHLSNDEKKRDYGNNYLASWSNLNYYKYWRLYFSGQFINLFNFAEYCIPEYAAQLKRNLYSYLSRSEREAQERNIEGFISITNIIYTMTEIFEFAQRLSNNKYFKSSIEIEILLDLKQLPFALSDTNKVVSQIYKSTAKILKHKDILKKESLPGEVANLSFKGIISVFHQFGWFNIPEKIIKEEQEKFLSGRII